MVNREAMTDEVTKIRINVIGYILSFETQ